MLIKAAEKDADSRIDTFAAEKTGITRSQIHKLIEEGLVRVNGAPTKASYKMRPGDEVDITLPEKQPDELVPEDIPLDILYSDEHLAVVNKPAGLVVYPAAGHPTGTLMNALRYRLGELSAPGGPLRPGVVHRLDKDTSGIMVVALSGEAYHPLVEQFSHREIKRTYVALISGRIKGESGKITRKIGRSMTDRKKMSVRTRKGKEAETKWDVIERFKNATLVRVKLATGRTHQIRVHFASVGHPVLGDSTYGHKTTLAVLGKKKLYFPRQMLHAKVLGFRHPVTHRKMRFTSPLPEDMQAAIEELGQHPSEAIT